MIQIASGIAGAIVGLLIGIIMAFLGGKMFDVFDTYMTISRKTTIFIFALLCLIVILSTLSFAYLGVVSNG